jgi:hypothetical protein
MYKEMLARKAAEEPNWKLREETAIGTVAAILSHAHPLMGHIENEDNKRLYFTFNGVKMAVILNPN